jgi:hypothetical protein
VKFTKNLLRSSARGAPRKAYWLDSTGNESPENIRDQIKNCSTSEERILKFGAISSQPNRYHWMKKNTDHQYLLTGIHPTPTQNHNDRKRKPESQDSDVGPRKMRSRSREFDDQMNVHLQKEKQNADEIMTILNSLQYRAHT